MEAADNADHDRGPRKGRGQEKTIEEEDIRSTVAVVGGRNRRSEGNSGREFDVNRKLPINTPRERSSNRSAQEKRKNLDDVQSLVVESNQGTFGSREIDPGKLVHCANCSIPEFDGYGLTPKFMEETKQAQNVMKDIKQFDQAGQAGCFPCRVISSGCRCFMRQNNISANKVCLETVWSRSTRDFGLLVRVDFQDARGWQEAYLEFFDTGT
jgi:hypothetical protein